MFYKNYSITNEQLAFKDLEESQPITVHCNMQSSVSFLQAKGRAHRASFDVWWMIQSVRITLYQFSLILVSLPSWWSDPAATGAICIHYNFYQYI